MATEITTVEELQGMSNNLSGDYVLGADIDASGYDFTPVGDSNTTFTGTLDGQGHTIDGLTISTTGVDVGLFGMASSGSFSVSNLTITNAQIETDDVYSGILVGEFYGVYQTYTATISNVHLEGTVTNGTNGYMGGVGGYMEWLTVENVTTDVTVDSSGDHTAGLVGEVYGGKFRNCHVSGTVSGVSEVGGVAGDAKYTDIQQIVVDADIEGSDTTGGIVGWQDRDHSDYPSVLGDAIATGTVYSLQSPGGGIAGEMAEGTVRRVVSAAEPNPEATDPEQYMNPLFGTITPTPSAAYWAEDLWESDGHADASPLTTDDLQGGTPSSVLTEFDFDTIWEETDGYPYLQALTADDDDTYSSWVSSTSSSDDGSDEYTPWDPILPPTRRSNGVMGLDGKTVSSEGSNYEPNHWRIFEDIPHWFFGDR